MMPGFRKVVSGSYIGMTQLTLWSATMVRPITGSRVDQSAIRTSWVVALHVLGQRRWNSLRMPSVSNVEGGTSELVMITACTLPLLVAMTSSAMYLPAHE